MACHYNFRLALPIFSNQLGSHFVVKRRSYRLSDLEQLLAKSNADESFKQAVRAYYATGISELVRVEGFAPRVKVRRLLAHILSTEAQLPIERVALRARSGCSDFTGTVRVHTASGSYSYEFIWDCRWRAEQQGWVDCFGFPDQIRAAQEYDWRCFQRWAPIGSTA